MLFLCQNGIELQRLIENLIDYNQLPHQELTFEEIDLNALWQELLNNYGISIDKKALQLALHGDVETWIADRYKLKTTLDNLLSNAINYTPEGGRIDIVWRAEGATLVIDVANSGEPIPTEDVERVRGISLRYFAHSHFARLVQEEWVAGPVITLLCFLASLSTNI